jgi:hypothetical protein
MIKRLILAGSGTAMVAVLAVLLVVGPSPPPLPDSPSDQASQAAPSSGPREGIHVHGHWVIEVRNPDSTLVDRREFENALTENGKKMLVALLNPVTETNFWEWNLWIGGEIPSGAGTGWEIWWIVTRLDKPESSKGLTYGHSEDWQSLVFHGTTRAPRDVTIDLVQTRPWGGNLDPGGAFSEAVAPGDFDPVGVLQNQIIDLTVIFSFS